MENNSADIQKIFKEIVAGLPEEKKKALYERLKSMSAEERNEMITAIVEKESEIEGKKPSVESQPSADDKKQPPKKQNPANGQQKQQPKKQQQKQQPKQQQKHQSKQQPGKQPQKQPQKQGGAQNRQRPQENKKAQPAKQAPDQPQRQNVKKQPEGKKPEKKDNSGKVRKAVLIIIILMALGVLGFTAYNKRESIIELWHTVTGTTEATQETSEPTEDTTAAPTSTPTPMPTSTPTPTPVPLADDAPDLTGLKIVLDPGHQQTTSEEVERVASWLSAEKSRCTTGGEGISTGIREYDLTLRFCVMLRAYLEGCGATVVMTREVNDIDLSNQERAQIATASGCDLFIRIHADSANDAATSGIQMYVPSRGNNFKTDKSRGEALGNSLSEITGLAFNGVLSTEVYTGLNYATTVHALQVSLGYLSNSDDEAVITNEEMQYNMVVAFAQFCKEYKR
ncbi:N-acetylmuramoyl-L-alanine amidase [Ruminococcaceae bacterium YRB3002]|nr:N-acetylmuramoyl-L-alanine amidase [Ruminococcaceae bacterium YRB3002]